MRQAYNPSVIADDNGEIFAFNLGADYCAEHEWGIDRLRRLMGIPASQDMTGLDYYRAQVPPLKNYLTFTTKGNLFMVLNGYLSWPDQKLAETKRGASNQIRVKADTFSGAWDESSFGITVSKTVDPKIMAFGKKLAKAIKDGDYAIWFGGENAGNPFARAGLIVAITSLVPQKIKDYMVEQHNELKRLKKADEATGIKELLKQKGKAYYACSPRFEQDGKTVVYWLNPMEQDTHNYGWFAPQELADWANGVAGNKIDKQPVTAKV